jgi:hypothetical protein
MTSSDLWFEVTDRHARLDTYDMVSQQGTSRHDGHDGHGGVWSAWRRAP